MPDPVAVLGTGTIGRSWAIVFARAGHRVRMYDELPGRADAALEDVADGLDLLAKHDWLAERPAEVLERVEASATLEDACAGVSYVQESIPERLDAKRGIFAALDELCPGDVVLASSASALPMSEIATGLAGAERCLVAHPTNPPHLVPLVELVPGRLTSAEVVERARLLLSRAGQRPIVCRKEVPGFVLNRLQMALFQEALFLAREQVATVADIDACVTDGLALRWAFLGPYLVEETNGESITEDLEKFGDAMRQLFRELARDLDGPAERDIELAREGVRELLGSRTHDDVKTYRDEMVLRLRRLRGEAPVSDTNGRAT
jgi:L-gulonate 3-dehydrogenase